MVLLPLPPNARRRSRFRIALAVVAALAVATTVGAQTAQNPAGANAPAVPASLSSKIGAQVKELQKIDVKQGDGSEAVAGKTVMVHYTGWLYDPTAPDGHGSKFDSSLDRGTPFSFPLGQGRVIRGWDEGVATMKVGGKRTLLIPPGLGYGAKGAPGAIPPNSTLLFEVELLEIKIN